jgi:hypothetical protein
MGWKSTIEISRRKAIAVVTAHLGEMTDEELGGMVELARGGDRHGYNYRVVPDEVIQRRMRLAAEGGGQYDWNWEPDYEG